MFGKVKMAGLISPAVDSLRVEQGKSAQLPSFEQSFHERIQTNERRLAEVRLQREKLQSTVVDEAEAAKALAEFDPLWESLTLREQTRLMQLMIERIDYDGHEGSISITFHPTGITALAAKGFAGDAA